MVVFVFFFKEKTEYEMLRSLVGLGDVDKGQSYKGVWMASLIGWRPRCCNARYIGLYGNAPVELFVAEHHATYHSFAGVTPTPLGVLRSLIHICRCRRIERCRPWMSPHH